MSTQILRSDKVWFVTGASKGLGLHLVQKLLKSGFRVAATSRNKSELIEKIGVESEAFLPLQMNLSDESNIAEGIARTIQHFKGLDVVVNNAGYGQFGAVEEVTDEEARANFEVNVFGVLNVIRAALPSLRAQRSGHIFNIASIGGFTGAYPGVGVYCATKFAVAGLTEGLNSDLASFGIKATVVYPGYFRTDFLQKGSIALPKRTIGGYDEAHKVVAMHAENINHQQPGDPDKAADALIQAAATEKAPLHLFLGKDAYETAQVKITSVQQELEAWKTVTQSTDL